jgi:hypothetical protein
MREDDTIVDMAVTNENTRILTVTETGYGRISPISCYRLQSRGGKGLMNYRVEKYGDVAAVLPVEENEDIIMIASNGIIIRIFAGDISEFARPAKGVRVMRVKDGEKILSVANNPKKYYLKSQLLKLRDGVKVSDFISPEAMSNLKNLTIGNKAICIDFFKDIKYNSRVKDFARIPWDLRGLPWSQRFVKTEDGFYVCIRQNIL